MTGTLRRTPGVPLSELGVPGMVWRNNYTVNWVREGGRFRNYTKETITQLDKTWKLEYLQLSLLELYCVSG